MVGWSGILSVILIDAKSILHSRKNIISSDESNPIRTQSVKTM